jgi:hypothetical protein
MILLRIRINLKRIVFSMCFTKTVYVDRPVEKIIEVPVYPELQDFPTFSDLESWFELHDELRLDPPNLCDDYARESRILAQTDGYFLSYCLVHEGKVYGQQIFNPDVFHIANMAIVTDTEEVYYVDLAFSKLIKLTNFIMGGKY